MVRTKLCSFIETIHDNKTEPWNLRKTVLQKSGKTIVCLVSSLFSKKSYIFKTFLEYKNKNNLLTCDNARQ